MQRRCPGTRICKLIYIPKTRCLKIASRITTVFIITGKVHYLSRKLILRIHPNEQITCKVVLWKLIVLVLALQGLVCLFLSMISKCFKILVIGRLGSERKPSELQVGWSGFRSGRTGVSGRDVAIF